MQPLCHFESAKGGMRNLLRSPPEPALSSVDGLRAGEVDGAEMRLHVRL
jgi:hypothetical protein